MNPDVEKKLAELIHRELTRLPERQAPETLITSVLARVESLEKKRWWQRPWPTWPFTARVISVPVLLCGPAALFTGLKLALNSALVETVVAKAAEQLQPVAPLWDLGVSLAGTGSRLASSFGSPWLFLGAAVLGLMYLTTVAVGTACFRVATARR